MAFRVGQRVVVNPLPDGHPAKAKEGKKGEVVEVRGEGAETVYLVDDQVVNGVRVGYCTMRELFSADELDHG